MKSKIILSILLSLTVVSSTITEVMTAYAADKELELVYETVFSETFDTLNLDEPPSYYSFGGSKELVGEGTNKYLKVSGINQRTVAFTFDLEAYNVAKNITATKNVKIEFDLIDLGNGQKQNLMIFNASGARKNVADWQGWFRLNGGDGNQAVTNNWGNYTSTSGRIHIEAEYDINAGKMSAVAYDGNTAFLSTNGFKTIGLTDGYTVGDISSIALGDSWWCGGMPTAIDNLKVSYGSYKPVATKVSKVEILANGDIQPMNTVHPASDIIKIYFTDDIDIGTVNSESVSVKNASSVMEWNESYVSADKCVVLVLTDTFPVGPETYTIKISDGVKDADGNNVQPYAISFTTTAGEITGSDEGLVDKGYNEFVYSQVFNETFENIDLGNLPEYVTVDGTNVIDTDAEGNKYLHCTTNLGSFSVDIKKLNEAKSLTKSDYIKIEYDIRQSDENGNKYSSGGFVNGDNGGYTIAGASWGSADNWTVLNGIGSTVNFSDGEWIHVRLEYNFVNNTVSGEMTDKAGNVKRTLAPESEIVNAGGNVTGFGGVLLNGGSSQSADGAYDNLEISYGKSVPKKPELTNENITIFTAMNDEVTDLKNVTPAIKKIGIDFKRSMDTTTLTDSTIYVVRKGESSHIPAILTYADGVVFVNFVKGIFERGIYTINVSGTVKNSNNVTLDDDFSMDFTVTEGEYKTKISSVNVGNKKVDNIIDISSNDLIAIEIEYSNATGVTQNLYVMFVTYKDTQMNSIDIYSAENIKADITSMTYKTVFTAPDMTDVTEAQVIIWSDWGEIKLLSPVMKIN